MSKAHVVINWIATIAAIILGLLGATGVQWTPQLPVPAAVCPACPAVPATPDATDPGAPTAERDGGPGVIGMALGILAAPIGCGNPALQQVGGSVGRCLLSCGASDVRAVIKDHQGGQAIDGAAIGWSTLDCVVPCLLSAGYSLLAQVTGSEGVADTRVAEFPVDRATPLERVCGSREGLPTCRLLVRPMSTH